MAPVRLARGSYRALNDALDEGHDQFDLSNRDVRLAMILMGVSTPRW